MARVRDHAKEYAALKARAQAAGLSTRAYRRARKQAPETYYSPRAQKTVARRIQAGEEPSSARTFGDKRSKEVLRLALLARGADPTTIDKVVALRVKHSTPDQRAQLTRVYRDWENDPTEDRLWLDSDMYDDIGFLLWYKDA